MQSIDLTRDAIKILGIYFSYNINLINQNNYCKAIRKYSWHFKTMEDDKSFY